MLVIVGKKDVPLYETNLGFIKKNIQHQHYFIMHASLDIVDEIANVKTDMYLKKVDSQSDVSVYSFLTAGNIRFLLLTDGSKSEELIKNFFIEVYEAFVKNMMNPLYDLNSPITSPYFDMKVKAISSKYF